MFAFIQPHYLLPAYLPRLQEVSGIGDGLSITIQGEKIATRLYNEEKKYLATFRETFLWIS